MPKVTIASATIGQPSAATGHAPRHREGDRDQPLLGRVAAHERRALISDADEVALDSAAKAAAGPLLSPLEPKASATGELRFTLPTAVAQRLLAAPTAKLRIAGRTVG